MSTKNETTIHALARSSYALMKPHNQLRLAAAFAAASIVTPARASQTTTAAIVTAVRVHVTPGTPYVRIEFDKTLNCGARLAGPETRRAYVYVDDGSSPNDQEVLNRIQSAATAALLSGKNVTVVVDETATSGVYAGSCKLEDIVIGG